MGFGIADMAGSLKENQSTCKVIIKYSTVSKPDEDVVQSWNILVNREPCGFVIFKPFLVSN